MAQTLSSTPEVGQGISEAPKSPISPTVPVYDERTGRLTYPSLCSIIRANGSVTLGGKVYTSPPSEMEYANSLGDEQAFDKAANDQQAKIDQLTRELAEAKSAKAKKPEDDKGDKGKK